ncbi:uncharacterized protein LOC144135083 isoform X2 [Amblyomma americanum]
MEAGTMALRTEAATEQVAQRLAQSVDYQLQADGRSRDWDRGIRLATSAGVLAILIVGLTAMAYSFNEAQRHMDNVHDSDKVEPRDLEKAWAMAVNRTTNTDTTTDDLDMISWITDSDMAEEVTSYSADDDFAARRR